MGFNVCRSVSFDVNLKVFGFDAFLIALLLSLDDILSCSLIHGSDIALVTSLLFNSKLSQSHVFHLLLLFLILPLRCNNYLFLYLALMSIPCIE